MTRVACQAVEAASLQGAEGCRLPYRPPHADAGFQRGKRNVSRGGT